MESVLHLRVHAGPTKHTHTDLSCICDPPSPGARHTGRPATFLGPGSAVSLPAPGLTQLPRAPHTQLPAAVQLLQSRLRYVSSEEQRPSPRGRFSAFVFGVLSPLLGHLGSLKSSVSLSSCLPGPWLLSTVSVRTVPLGSAWPGTASPHTSSRRAAAF